MQYHKNTGLRWTTYRYVEAMVKDYDKYDDLIEKRREEILAPYRVSDENIGGGRSGMTNNTVERVATALVTDRVIVRLEAEKQAVSEALEALDEQSLKVIKLAYLIKPRTKTWVGIADECFYSVRSCYRIRDGLIKDIAEKLSLS